MARVQYLPDDYAPSNRAQRRRAAKNKLPPGVKPVAAPDTTASVALLSDVRPFEEDEIQGLKTMVRVDFTAVMEGHDTDAQLSRLILIVVTARVRAESIDESLLAPLDEAHRILKAREKAIESGSPTPPSPKKGLVISEALDIYDAILGGSSPRQMKDALRVATVRCGAVPAF